MYPNVLIKIADFLRNHEGELVEKGAGDGRTASTLAESSIITLLKNNGFRVESTDNRAWCDFVVENKYFVDIKINDLMNMNAAGNVASKKQIYYVLTGRHPDEVSNAGDKFFKQLRDNLQPNDKDLYYLIVGKGAKRGSPERAFVTSLKTLPEVTVPHWKNLPFQCVWGKCIDGGSKRNYEEAKDFLLSNWSKGIKKAVKNFQVGMPKHFPEYFE